MQLGIKTMTTLKKTPKLRGIFYATRDEIERKLKENGAIGQK
jgi:hypothetical protein